MSTFEAGRVMPNAPVRLALARALSLLVLALAPLRAELTLPVATTPGSGITFRLASPVSQLPHFGFLPVRASVENLGARDGEWDLRFQIGNGGSAAPFTLQSHHTISVPAGQTRELWLYVPVARAGFATNAPGAGGPVAVVTKTPAGTRITRTTNSVTGRVLMSIVTDINETTGELTTQNISGTGTVLSTNASRPPAGQSVTYTIDPSRGFVAPRYRPNAGGFSVTVVTGSGGGGVAMPAAPTPPKVSVTPMPYGMKVTRETGLPRVIFTEVYEFDIGAGAVRISRTGPNGATATNTRSIPATPGTETTYTINPTDGTHGTQTRLVPNSTAPAKMLVVVATRAAISPPATRSTIAPGTPTAIAVGTTVVAEISGSGIKGLVRVAMPNNPGANPMRPFAVALGLESDLRSALSGQVSGAPNLATVAVAQLPADWRLWSSFAGVILPADEFAALDAARRAALRGWVGLGGQLFLMSSAPGAERSESVGAGRIVTLPSTVAGGLGPALRTALNLYGETIALPDRESLFLKNTVLGEEIKIEAPDSSWVAIFLVIFAAIIGPANLFVFAPVPRRHRLFWTTPALALLGGLVLVVVIFFQDGLGGSGRRSALVVLLPGQNQAAVFQEQAARTGFLPRRAFALDPESVFAPLAVEAENLRFGVSSTASRDEAQAGGDWFRSRAVQAHVLRRLAPTRGRVEIAATAPDGAPIVESSLATVLREFVLQDAAGKLWSAPEIPPGRRVTLTPAPREATLDFATLGGSAALLRAYGAATTAVPGRWSASGGETEVAPIATLPGIRWADTQIAYTGVAEQPAKPSAKGGTL